MSVISWALALAVLAVGSVCGQLMVHVLERTHDSDDTWRDADKCVASRAEFGAHIAQDSQIAGCALPVIPVEACGDNPPTYNHSQAFSIQNAIALVIRGNCSFAQKVYNVQRMQQSATIVISAVIVYDNESREDAFVMAKDGVYDDKVTLPSVMVTLECGLLLLDTVGDTEKLLMITGASAYDLIKYLIPFLAVIGFCFFVLLVALAVKYIGDRRREARRRLSKRSLKKIPVRKYKKGEEPDTCAICLDEFEEGEKLRVLPCNHAYHCKCVDTWLTKNRKVCPVCKRKVRIGNRSSDESSTEADDAEPVAAPQADTPSPSYNSTTGQLQHASTCDLAAAAGSASPDTVRASIHCARGARSKKTKCTCGAADAPAAAAAAAAQQSSPATSRSTLAGSTGEPVVSVGTDSSCSYSGPEPVVTTAAHDNHAFDNQSATPPPTAAVDTGSRGAATKRRRRHPAAHKGVNAHIVQERLSLESSSSSEDESRQQQQPPAPGTTYAAQPLEVVVKQQKKQKRKKRSKVVPTVPQSLPASLPAAAGTRRQRGRELVQDEDDDDEGHEQTPVAPELSDVSSSGDDTIENTDIV